MIFGATDGAAAAAGVETYLVNRNERRRKAAATHGEQGTDDDDGGGDRQLTDGDMLREIYREIRRTRVARIEGQAALSGGTGTRGGCRWWCPTLRIHRMQARDRP